MKMSKKRLVIIGVVVVIIAAIGMYPVLSKKFLRPRNSHTLTIYALAYNGKLNYDIEPIVNEFKEKYPNIKLNIVKFSSDRDYQKYNEKILSDTLAGEGPDIIYFDPEETNARAFQKSGMLEDLKPYIEKDKDFNKEDYNSKLLNAGMYKGKLTFIPTDYIVPAYITTKELLEKNNIKITENMSQNDFMKSLSGYISKAKSSNGKTLFAKSIDVGDFITSSGFECVDYENKKMYFGTKEFKDIMENYKKIYNSTPKPVANGGSDEEGLQGIKNGSTLFSTDVYYTCGMGFWESESTIKGLTGQTQVINSFPTYRGDNKIIAIPKDLIGMSKKTLNKKAAYNFIKLALSEKIQCDDKIYMPPINKKSQIDIKNRYLKEEVGKDAKEYKIILNRPSDDFNKYYDRVTNNIDEVRILDTDVDKLIKECMTPYFEDKSSYDSALKNLQNKVKLYINE